MTKSLYVAWRTQNPENPAWGPIGRLEFENGEYRFYYTKGARILPAFRPFFGMENLDLVYRSTELPPLFANRLLSKSRPEYDAYLCWSGFDYENPPDPLAILAVNEGQRQTDAIEVFPCPVPDADGCYFNRFFVHGIRYSEETARAFVEKMQADDHLRLVPDPDNPVDPHAVALYPADEDFRIGYVPRYLANDINTLHEHCGDEYVDIVVQQVNSDAPLQQRLLCRMHACWPEGFQPCSSEMFQPIPAGVSADCGA